MRKLILSVVLLAVLGWSIFQLYQSTRPFCDSMDFVNTSVAVAAPSGRRFFGFNTDTGSLVFGTLSPGVVATRTLQVQASRPGTVRIVDAGSIAAWLSIDPAQFKLAPGSSQQVLFTLSVPAFAPKGNYTGEVRFCYRWEEVVFK